MSRKEDIDNGIWSDPEFLSLTSPAKLTYIWTWTNPRCPMAGLYKMAPALAQLETGYDQSAFSAALDELAQARFAFFQDGVLFVRTRVKHMRQRTEQIAKAIRSDVAKIHPDHPLRAAWIDENARLPWLVKFLGKAWEIDGQPTLSGGSLDGQAVSSLEGSGGSSVEAHLSLKGNGNGKGNGKGPQGRGAGEGTDFFAMADEMGVHHGYVRHYLDSMKIRKQKPTREVMRKLLEQHMERPAA